MANGFDFLNWKLPRWFLLLWETFKPTMVCCVSFWSPVFFALAY